MRLFKRTDIIKLEIYDGEKTASTALLDTTLEEISDRINKIFPEQDGEKVSFLFRTKKSNGKFGKSRRITRSIGVQAQDALEQFIHGLD